MIRASFKLATLLLWIACLYPIVWCSTKINKPAISNAILRFTYAGIARICEIKVHVHGKLSEARPLLAVSNHISYIDIPVLGSLTHFCFTPKSEIATWPFVGNICKMTNCVFINRKPDKVQQASDAVHGALNKGDVVLLFPEATTGNGIHLVDFKSSMFHLAQADFGSNALTIQPIAIIYKAIRGLPIGRTQWPSIAWYGDMELMPHMLAFMALGPIDVEVSFLPALTINPSDDRKQLAKLCQQLIADRIVESKKEPVQTYAKRFSIRFASSRSKS